MSISLPIVDYPNPYTLDFYRSRIFYEESVTDAKGDVFVPDRIIAVIPGTVATGDSDRVYEITGIKLADGTHWSLLQGRSVQVDYEAVITAADGSVTFQTNGPLPPGTYNLELYLGEFYDLIYEANALVVTP